MQYLLGRLCENISVARKVEHKRLHHEILLKHRYITIMWVIYLHMVFDKVEFPVNPRRLTNAGLMLAHCLRR